MGNSLFRLFRFWRLGVLLIAEVSIFFIARNTNFNLIKEQFRLSDLLTIWTNFDGVHYLNIAKYGYEAGATHYTEAFFPIYPFTIRLFSLIFRSYILSGLIVSHLSLYLAFVYLIKLLQFDFPKKFGLQTIILVLAFPTSFYLGSVYSESLFFLLSILTFYHARKKHWLLAALLASLASATRLVGIFLFPALLLEYYFHTKSLSSFLRPQALVLLLAPLGLIIYMIYLYFLVHDPIYFVHVQPIFNAARQVNTVVLLHQVFFRYIKIALTVNPFSHIYFVAMLEFITGILFFVVSLLSLRIRPSYGLYSLAAFLLPTLTGTLSSVPRYILVLFPAFIVLNQFLQDHPKLKFIYFTFCILALIYSAAYYTAGYFVS